MKKVMATYEKLREQLLRKLEHLENAKPDETACMDACLNACYDSLRRLREEVDRQPFGDTATEIWFFKSVKPVVVSRCIYYGIRFQLCLDACTLDKEMLIQHYEQHLRLARQCLIDNKHLYNYFLAGDTTHDEAYFLRVPPRRLPHQDVHSIINPHFATSMDNKLAQILASKLIIECLEKKLAFLREPPCRADGPLVPVLPCTATVSQVVEMVKALSLARIFGPRTLDEVMQAFGNFLQMDLSNHAIIATQFRTRKISRTRFLDGIRDELNGYFDNLDARID